MLMDTLTLDDVFAQWQRAKTAYVGLMQRALLSAAFDADQAPELLAAASLALADMQAAHERVLALRPATAPEFAIAASDARAEAEAAIACRDLLSRCISQSCGWLGE